MTKSNKEKVEKENYMTEKEKESSVGKTRREFLKDAGLLVGGTAIGSTVLLAACGGGEETTKTVTQTQTQTATVTTTAGATTVTDTVTSTVGAGQTVTETQTESRFVCPIDGMEFDTLAELQAHFAAAHPGEEGIPGLITLNVNGKAHIVQVEPYWPLTFVLREKLGLTGTKLGCERGECGSCTILMDGVAVLSCMVLAVEAEGHDIVTVEGLADGPNLHPVQQLFSENETFQCGFCTCGNIMSAVALLEKNPNPTRAQVKEAMSGNLCFCGDYSRIVNTVLKGGS